MLAQTLKDDKKVVEGTVDVFHIIRREVFKKDTVVALFLVLSHEFPLNIKA
jgi:hypothetical protein